MRRVLPVLVPFAISVALAAAFQASLVRSTPAEPPPRPTVQAERSITLTSGETRIVCRTTLALGVDVLELRPDELTPVALAVCRP